jgi:predicted PurR-regulated permease PerM
MLPLMTIISRQREMPLKERESLGPDTPTVKSAEVRETEASNRRRPDMPDWLPWVVAAVPITVLLTLIAVRFFSAITGVLAMIVFAEFFALALEPGVNWLAARGWRRGAATAFLMLAVVGVLVGAFLLVLPTFISELAQLFDNLPALIADLADRLNIDVSTADIQSAITDHQENLAQIAGDVAGNVLNLTSGILETVGRLATVFLLAFYLTAEAPKVRRNVLSLFPKTSQAHLLTLWEISIDKVGGYLYSRALMGTVSGTCSYVFMRILGVPFAAPLAIFIGFVSQFVPVVGTYIAYAVPSFIALASQGVGDTVALVIFAIIYQQIENLFISPRLSARTMKLHPAVAFVAALVGGSIGGVTGAFLALPIAAIFQAFVSTFLTRYEVIASELTRDKPREQNESQKKRSVREKLRQKRVARHSARQSDPKGSA